MGKRKVTDEGTIPAAPKRPRGITPKHSSEELRPDLTMELFAPGMTALHRAGLGGLACTLRYIEKAYQQGALSDDDVPGGPWADPESPPWAVAEDAVILRFGQPENGPEYLKRLFAQAFQLRDGMIYLPGQYGNVPPSLAVRVELQNGLLLTLYDHAPKARGVREAQTWTIEVDEKPITIRGVSLTWYKHMRDAAGVAVSSLSQPQPLSRMLLPGAIVRHRQGTNESAVVMPAKLMIPLLFAPVGTFALRMGAKRVTVQGKRVTKSGGVLVVPDFADLTETGRTMPALLPRSARDTRVGSVGDAVLSVEARLLAEGLLATGGLSGIRCVWCCPTDWNSRLQPLSSVLEVATTDLPVATVERYALAQALLPSRVIHRGEQYDWQDSVVRPLVANNLARGRAWYERLYRLATALSPDGRRLWEPRRPLRERGGLFQMATNGNMLDPDERLVVESVHEAIRYRRGRIRAETDGDGPLSDATLNKWDRFEERLRLDLAGAKTQPQLRFTLSFLFSGAGRLPTLRDHWPRLLPMLDGANWERTRDLAMVALASYGGDTETESNQLEGNP